MTVFYVYSPDGGPQPPEALEYALNLDVPRTQLIQRTRTGIGEGAFVADRPAGTTLARAWRTSRREEEWPAAGPGACLWVWWRYAAEPVPDITTEPAEEVWRMKPEGGVDRQRFADDPTPAPGPPSIATGFSSPE